MPGPLLDIKFPTKGLSEYTGYTDQPPDTSPSVKNWILRDPSSGRARGAKRAGTTRYVATQVNSTNAVQCIASLNRQNSRIAYAAVNGGSGPRNAEEVVWQADVPDARLGDVRAMDVDRFGNVYVLSGRDGLVCKYGGDGTLIWKHTVKVTSTSTTVYKTLYCIRVDYDGDVFIGVGGTSGAINGVVYRFQQVRDGLEQIFEWGTGDVGGLVADIAIEGQWMYVAENTGDGYILHRVGGIKSRSPAQEWAYDLSGTAVNQPVTAVGILPDGSAAVSYRYDTASTGLGDNQPNTGRVAVISQQGQLLDIYGNATTEGGCGWGMDIDTDGNIYVTGRQQSGAGNATDSVVKLAWSGSALSRTWGFNGATGGAVDYGMPGSFQGPDSLCVDRDGRVYIGIEDGTNTHNLFRLTAAGALDWAVAVAEFADIYAIRPDAFYPVIEDDPTYGASGPEYIFVGGNDIGANGSYSLFKLRLLNATITDDSPRTLQVLAVAGGTIKKKSGSSWATPTGGVTLDSNLRFISAASGFDAVYFADGETYVKYDPNGDSGNGSVETWRATVGRLPARCKLITIWNNRLVLARGSDDPFNWYMSRAGDFEDWDFFPFPADVGQAIAGNNAPAGLSPDIINAVVPYSDDLLIIGGDRSIWRMTGDPADGGRWDLVSDITGMAFGQAWCKSPEGILFFMGSRGGVFSYAPGGQPVEISNAFIRERLAVLDFSANRVQLAWNDRERCLMVFIMPTNTSAPTNYIYDLDNGGWWPFDFSTTAVTADQVPNCVHVIDGDASSDRLILIGTHIGYVWYWDVSADSDDDGNSNYVIDADIYMGPYVPFPDGEARVTKVYSVLGASSANVTLSVYGSDSPDFGDIGSAKLTGTLSSNRTAPVNGRARGHAIWFRLQNNTASQRCQVESLRAEMWSGARVRVRT